MFLEKQKIIFQNFYTSSRISRFFIFKFLNFHKVKIYVYKGNFLLPNVPLSTFRRRKWHDPSPTLLGLLLHKCSFSKGQNISKKWNLPRARVSVSMAIKLLRDRVLFNWEEKFSQIIHVLSQKPLWKICQSFHYKMFWDTKSQSCNFSYVILC